MPEFFGKRLIFSFLFIFIVGGIGGVFFDRFAVPILDGVWPFSFIFAEPIMEPGVTVMNRKEEITVRENVALEKAIEKTLKTVVKVEALSARGTLQKEGTGILVTNDGLVLVPYDLVKQGVVYVVADGARHEAGIFKKDSERNLAILMLKEGRFPAASFGDAAKLKLGERIFLLGFGVEEAGSYPFALEGIVKSLQDSAFEISMFDSFAHGAPIFTIEGELVGISLVGGKDLLVVPISVIRPFLGF